MEHLRDRKWRLVFQIGILFLLILLAAVYYYGLHLSFWPDAEYCVGFAKYHLADKFGVAWGKVAIKDFFLYVPYKLFGMSYTGIRVYASLVYFTIMLFTSVLALYSFSTRDIKWYIIPLFIFVSVILNPGSTVLCGHHRNIYHLYPYDMHSYAIIFSVAELFLVSLYLQTASLKAKKGIALLIALVSIIALKESDILFVIGFLAPLACVVLGILWKEHRRILLYGILGLLSMLVLLRFLSIFIEPLQGLFAIRDLSYGNWTEGGIYGVTGFADCENIWNNISNTITAVLALFNVELSGKAIFSVYSVICFIRIGLVIVVYVLSFYYIGLSVCKKDYNYDIVSLLCAYGILLNTVAVMFSEYGMWLRCIRWLVLLIFYGAIIICRNADILFLLDHDKRYVKNIVFVGFILCILINAVPFWKEDSYKAEYEDAIKGVAQCIEENALGDGIGGHWNANNLTMLMNGKYTVFMTDMDESGLNIHYTIPDLKLYYIVDGPEDFDNFDMEKIVSINGKPDHVYEIDSFLIYYYKEGIHTTWS